MWQVRKLLEAGADPTLTNHHHRSPLDVACEFGRIRVHMLITHLSPCCCPDLVFAVKPHSESHCGVIDRMKIWELFKVSSSEGRVGSCLKRQP